MALSNFSWVIPGKLAGSDMPGDGSGNVGILAEDIGFLASQGIGMIVSLERPAGPIAEVCADAGIIWRLFPVVDFGVPAINSEFTAFIAACIQSFTSGTAVCVHCRAGIGRTGLIISCILGTYLHLDGEKAVAAVREVRSAIETVEQKRFIISFLSEYEN